MSKRTVFTTITPIPEGVSREVVLETLHNHVEMIDLNPLVIERSQCKPPDFALPEELDAVWYSITDKVVYFPGASGKVTFQGCFHNLQDGLQTHIHAPLGLEIKSRWLVGGSLPGEPSAPQELGLNIPKTGLYLREDVDMKCNFMTTPFVKKTITKSHSTLVDCLVEKSKAQAVNTSNANVAKQTGQALEPQPQQHANDNIVSSSNNQQEPLAYSPYAADIAPLHIHKQSNSQAHGPSSECKGPINELPG